MTQIAIDDTPRTTAPATAVANRRRRLQVVDTAVVLGFIAGYATSSSSTLLHAVVSLLWSAAVVGHFWIHRKWFKSVARRLSKSRSKQSRGSAFVTVVIIFELTAAVLFGVAAWLGQRSLKGLHGGLANVLVFVAVAHVAVNLHQLKALVRRRTMVIDRRFRGSPEHAQGGYAAGRAASHAQGTVNVKLLSPPPIEQDLLVEVDCDERVTVFGGSDLLMEASPTTDLIVDLPASTDVIREIFERGPAISTKAQNRPHCFGCGPERDDGLGLTTLPVGSTGIWGTTWTPNASLPASDGVVDSEMLWAALDCPGSFAASDSPDEQVSASLDEITVQIRGEVRVGETVAVMAWRLPQSGTTVDCGAAIVDSDGRVKAYARLCHSLQA